jgi:pilus assembly protein CpaB
MSKRTIALVVAVVLAAVATVALVSYVRGYEDRVQRNQELVQVFVAKDVIPKGTTGDFAIERGLIDRIGVPRQARADGAIATLDEIKGDVADGTVFKGEQIISNRFVPPGRVSADVLTVPPNRVAMSMEVGVPPGVAQFIQIGDHVTILAQFTLTGGRAQESRLTKVLLHDIEVLQIGKLVRAVPAQGQPATQSVTVPDGTVLLTLALSMPQAEKLTNAIFNGRLYVTLLPKTGKPSPNTPGRTDSNPFA